VRIPFRLVDVFTDRPLDGNQLCVVPDPVELSDQRRQAIAREIGFSETTFVTEAGGDRYAMRIFTPAAELPFAGHPTLGTAFVMVSEGRVKSPATQVLSSGEFGVEVDVEAGFARMEQRPPTLGREEPGGPDVAASLGLEVADLDPERPVQVVSTGLPYLIVPTAGQAALARVAPDPRRLPGLLNDLGADGVYVFCPEPSRDRSQVRARMFAPGVGMPEDAATGSAAGPLGAYLVEHGMVPLGRVTIMQGVEMGRPSTLLVDVDQADSGEGWTIHVGGGVARVGEGAFDLPD